MKPMYSCVPRGAKQVRPEAQSYRQRYYRVLEYFPGILLFTTNGVGAFNQAG